MRTARQRDEHRAALDRRFAQLQAELHGLPAAPQQPPSPDPGPSGTRLRVVQPWAPDHLEPDPAPWSEPTGPTEPATEPASGAPLLPTPGRHAARRPRPVPRDWAQRASAPLAPATARWTLAPAHLRVVAVVVVLALLGTGWWLVRSRPESLPSEVGLTVAPPAATPAPTGGLTATAAPATDPGAGSEPVSAPASEPVSDAGEEPGPGAQVVIVHVAGRVRRPGIVRLPVGARVADALEAAGGSRPGVRLAGVNLARTLVDGEQVLVGIPGAVPAAATAPAGVAGAPASPTGQPTLVDLNTADQVLLETLPGVGPVTAGKILAWREQHGRFSAVEELLEIDGIGDVTLAELAPLVTV